MDINYSLKLKRFIKKYFHNIYIVTIIYKCLYNNNTVYIILYSPLKYKINI